MFGRIITTAIASFCFAAALILPSTRAAHATVWQPGDEITYAQADWGTAGAAAALLTDHYNSVYFPTGDLFVLGDISKFIEQFDSASALEAYFPQAGTAGILTGSLANPTTSSAGVFGGDVGALKLNVDFSAAGYTLGASGIPFGDLILANLGLLPNLNGLTVSQFLSNANLCLGGGGCIDDVASLDLIANRLNASFAEGTVVEFAQDNLVAPTSPVSEVPEPSTLLLFAAGMLSFLLIWSPFPLKHSRRREARSMEPV